MVSLHLNIRRGRGRQRVESNRRLHMKCRRLVAAIRGQPDKERARQREHNYAACRRVISAKAARPSPVNEYGAPRS
jgi:hypothetical protein